MLAASRQRGFCQFQALAGAVARHHPRAAAGPEPWVQKMVARGLDQLDTSDEIQDT